MSRFKKAYQREPASVPTPSPGEVPQSAYRLQGRNVKKVHNNLRKQPDAVPSIPKKGKAKENEEDEDFEENP